MNSVKGALKTPRHLVDDPSKMHADASSANTYLRTRVMTASPEELRLLLLDGAIKFAQQGREAMVNKDFEGIYDGVRQCRQIVIELLTSIKEEHDPELAARIRSVYSFLYGELMTVGTERSVERMDNIIRLLEFERETWVLLMKQVQSERTAGNGTESEQVAAPSNGSGDERPSLSIQA